MTEKQKALELTEKYLETIIHFPYIDTEDGYCIGTGYMTHNSAVRCAINAVDEMIEHCSQVEPFLGVDFWSKVKEELKELRPSSTG
jgi:hypothetical protein